MDFSDLRPQKYDDTQKPKEVLWSQNLPIIKKYLEEINRQVFNGWADIKEENIYLSKPNLVLFLYFRHIYEIGVLLSPDINKVELVMIGKCPPIAKDDEYMQSQSIPCKPETLNQDFRTIINWCLSHGLKEALSELFSLEDNYYIKIDGEEKKVKDLIGVEIWVKMKYHKDPYKKTLRRNAKDLTWLLDTLADKTNILSLDPKVR